MLKAAWKSVIGHKARLLLSTIAIVLGIAFLSAVLSFNNMMNSTFDGIVSGATADVNILPQQSTSATDAEADSMQPLFPAADVSKVAAVDGVESANGMLQGSGVYPLDKKGKLIGTTGAPGLAFNFVQAKAYNNQPGLVLLQGRGPERAGEVAVDPQTLKRGGYKVGDPIKISVGGETGTVAETIVGVANWGSGGSAGATYTYFDDQTMQKYFANGQNAYTGVWVVAKPGQDLKQLTDRINAAGLPAGFHAVDGKTSSDESSKQIKDQLSFITNFLLVFAAVGLIVAVFLIVNTFTILVAQRSRELALYRALGASRGQVTRSVLLEAIVVGLVGSVLGTVAGWGLALLLSAGMKSMGMELGSATAALNPSGLLVCGVVGVVTTLVAALMPARRAGRVPPVAAMSGDAMTGKQGLGARAFVGIAMALVGLGLLFLGLWTHVPHRLYFVGGGAALTLIGVTFASPILGWPVIKLFEGLYRLVFGSVGRLAAMNATRNPRRTAATASALMIGVTLVSTFAILGNSAQKELHGQIVAGIKSQLIVSTRAQQGWSSGVTQTMASTPGVKAVHTIGFTAVFGPDRKPVNVAAMSDGTFDGAVTQKIVAGREATAAGELVVTQKELDSQHWELGQQLQMFTTNAQPLTLTVVGVFENEAKGLSFGNIMTPTSTFANQKPAVGPALAFVDAEPGTNADQLATAISDRLTDEPLIQVQSVDQFSKSMTASVDQILSILYALLGVAVVIAIFGIVNTMVLSILERRREIGLLRAVGLVRGQLRTMIGLESIIISVLGAALGIGMGLLFGWALGTTVLGKGSFSIPWDQLGIFLALSIVVGLLAGVVPAIAASRMHTLRAIASD